MGGADDYAALRNEKAEAFKESCNGLFQAFRRVQINEAHSRTRQVKLTATEIRSLLPKGSVPAWLGQIINAADSVEKQIASKQPPRKSNAPSPIERLFDATLKARISKFKGLTVSDETIAIDFDQMYEDIATRHDLESLFHKLISSIRAIIDTGKVDSTTVKNGLRQIIADLESAKDGSFLAATFSVVRSKSFFKHVGLRALKKFGIADVLIGAMEDAQRELDAGLSKVEEEARNVLTTTGLQQITEVTVVEIGESGDKKLPG